MFFNVFCFNLLEVRYGLIVWKSGFCHLSSSRLEDHLQNDLKCVEWDVKPYNTILYYTNTVLSYQKMMAEFFWWQYENLCSNYCSNGLTYLCPVICSGAQTSFLSSCSVFRCCLHLCPAVPETMCQQFFVMCSVVVTVFTCRFAVFTVVLSSQCLLAIMFVSIYWWKMQQSIHHCPCNCPRHGCVEWDWLPIGIELTGIPV